MSFISLHAIGSLLDQYGYVAIFLGVMLESMGVPLPGESMMIAAALYAASTSAILSAVGSVTGCWHGGDAKSACPTSG
jgi:membrane protein DedA with SNARE-associated domain